MLHVSVYKSQMRCLCVLVIIRILDCVCVFVVWLLVQRVPFEIASGRFSNHHRFSNLIITSHSLHASSTFGIRERCEKRDIMHPD